MDNEQDQANITFSLLEDSLTPLKCSFSSKCLFESYKNSEFNPLTLKFKSKPVNTCHRHRYLRNPFFRCLPRSLRSCLISKERIGKYSMRSSTSDNKTEKLKRQLISSTSENQVATIAMGHRGIIDDTPLSANCVGCMKENKGFSSFNSSREQLYNSQPSLMFKYHVGMAAIVFSSLATVIFMSELEM